MSLCSKIFTILKLLHTLKILNTIKLLTCFGPYRTIFREYVEPSFMVFNIFNVCKSFRIVKILEQRETCANSWSNNPYILGGIWKKNPINASASEWRVGSEHVPDPYACMSERNAVICTVRTGGFISKFRAMINEFLGWNRGLVWRRFGLLVFPCKHQLNCQYGGWRTGKKDTAHGRIICLQHIACGALGEAEWRTYCAALYDLVHVAESPTNLIYKM